MSSHQTSCGGDSSRRNLLLRMLVMLLLVICLQVSESASATTVIPCTALNETGPLRLTTSAAAVFEVRDCVPDRDSPQRFISIANSVNVSLVLLRSFVRVEVVNSNHTDVTVYDLRWRGGPVFGAATALITVEDSSAVVVSLTGINITLVNVDWSNTSSRLIDMSPSLTANPTGKRPSDVATMRGVTVQLSNVTVNIATTASIVNVILSFPSVVSEMSVRIEGCRWDVEVQDSSDRQHALIAFTQVYDARYVDIHIINSNFSTLSTFSNISQRDLYPLVPISIVAIQDAIDLSSGGAALSATARVVQLPCNDVTITVTRCVTVMRHLYGMKVGNSFLQLYSMNYTSRLQPKNVRVIAIQSEFDLVGHDHAHVVGLWAISMVGLFVEIRDCNISVVSRGPAWNEQIIRSAAVVRFDGLSAVNDSSILLVGCTVVSTSQAGSDSPVAMDGCSGPVATVITGGQMVNASLSLIGCNITMSLDFGYAATFITKQGTMASPFFSGTVAAILLDCSGPATALDSTFLVVGCNVSFSLSFAVSLGVLRPFCFLLATGMFVSTVSLIHTTSVLRNNTVLIFPILHPIDKAPTTLLSLYDTALWANAAAPRGATFLIVNNSVLIENVIVLDSNVSFGSMMAAIPVESRATTQQRTSFNVVGLTGPHLNTTVVVRGLQRRSQPNVSGALEFTAVGMRGVAGIPPNIAGDAGAMYSTATQIINSSLSLENVTIDGGFALAWRDTAVVDPYAKLTLMMNGCHLTAPATNASGPLSVFRLVPVYGLHEKAPIPKLFASVAQSTFSGYTDIFQATSVGWSSNDSGNFRVSLGCNEFDNKPLLAREIGAPDQYIVPDPQVVDGTTVDGIACEDPFRRKLPLPAMSKGRMAAGAAVAAVGLGSASFCSAFAQRGMLLASLSLCVSQLDDEESPPPLSDSLLQLSIGQSPNAYDRGTIVGNIIVVAALNLRLLLVGVTAAGGWSRLMGTSKMETEPTVTSVLNEAGLPGNMVSPLLLLLQPCVTAATSIVSSPSPDVPQSVLYWLLCFAATVAPSCAVTLWSARHVRFLIPLPTAKFSSRRGTAAELFRRAVASLRWLTISTVRWEADGTTASRQFLMRFEGVVGGYRSGRVWFAALEVALTIAFGVVGGIRPTAAEGCLALEGVNAALCILALIGSVVLTPCSTRLGNLSMIVSNALNTVGSICLVAGDNSSAGVIGLISAWLGVATFILELLSEGHFIGWRRAFIHRFISMRSSGWISDQNAMKRPQLSLPSNKDISHRDKGFQFLDGLAAKCNNLTNAMTVKDKMANLKVLIELACGTRQQ